MTPDLPFHPLTGLQAVGLRRNGDPVWPILGAAEEDDDEEAQRLLAEIEKEDAEKAKDEKTEKPDDEDDGLTDEQKKALGDPGKQALDRMKERWRKERDRAKAAEAKLASSKAKPEDEKPDLDALREQAREEARNESLRERTLDKIEARAARLFKDPEDAVLRLGRNVDDYLDGGKIDVDAIDDALNELLEKRPDFKVTQGDAKEEKRFKGSADAGAREKPAGKPQLTQADVEALAKAGKYSEIEDARVDGRLNKLLGIT